MNSYTIIFKYFKPAFFLLLFFQCLLCVTASEAQDNESIRSHLKQAQELMNTNKNSQALDVLEQAGRVQVRKFSSERDSVIRALQSDFVRKKQFRLTEISRKNDEITVLKAGNEDIDQENFKMIRSTLLFFGALVGLAVLLLLNRFRKLALLKENVISSDAQLAEIEKVVHEHQRLNDTNQALVEKWTEAETNLTAAASLLQKISTEKQHPDYRASIQLLESTQTVHRVIQGDHDIEPAVRVPVDLNQMIEEVANQAYYHTAVENPDFRCTVAKDLEKILPKVELIPADIKFVLYNLLINAFYAVNEKRSDAPKGYEPKVTISSRKLPRFVQIRIRDNGTGIREKKPEVLFDPFYTTKNSKRNPGLGLTESRRIITGIYKGELFIESDFTSGTDFIIRFPVLTLM